MRKTVKRATLVLALTPLVSVPMTAAGLADVGSGSTTSTITTPAPSGDASAVAAEVNGVIAIGKTTAHAGSDGGSSSADGLDVLGQRVSGGDQKGPGSSGGNLIGTGDTPIGDAEVAPWSNKVTDDNGGVQSAAEAALAHAKVNDVVELWLLHSKSAATWNPAQSTGDSESDGAEVSALGLLDVKVLHSEAHSTGKGFSSLLVVNGTPIVSSDDAGGSCQIDASPVLNLICLTASGGAGEDGVTSATGTVAGFDVGGGAITGTVSNAAAQGSGAPPTVKEPRYAGGETSGGRVPAAHRPVAKTPVAKTPDAASLPFTGADAERLVSLALATTVLGGAMTAYGRLRRRGLPA